MSAVQDKVLSLRKKGLSQNQIALDVGVSRKRVRTILYKHGITGSVSPPGMDGVGVKKDQKGDELSLTGGQIDTLEDLLRESNTDLDTWEVERHVVNSWNNYRQVKAWLKRKTETRYVEHLKKDLLAFIEHNG